MYLEVTHLFQHEFPAYLLQAFGDLDSGMNILNDAVNLSQNTVESWNEAWDDVLDVDNSGLWAGTVQLGTILGALSIIYLAIKDGSEIVDRGSWTQLVRLFVWPTVIIFFLAGNGSVLAGTIGVIRAVGYDQVRSVLEFQLADLTFADAMTRQNISSATEDQLINLYGDCMGLPPEELFECRAERADEAEAIISESENQFGVVLDNLREVALDFGSFALGPAAIVARAPSLIESRSRNAIRLILFGLQWMFVNLLEAALLLTALFFPVAMGLSLLPFQGRLILACLTGFIGLFSLQFGYNIIVGLVANRIGGLESAGASDIGFSMLLAIGAPALAFAIAKGGGTAVYSGLQGTAAQINGAVFGTIGTVAGAAIAPAAGVVAGSAAAKLGAKAGGGDSSEGGGGSSNDTRSPTR